MRLASENLEGDVSRIVLYVVSILLASEVARAQEPPETAGSLERTAARAAVERIVNLKPGMQVAVDPMIVRANDAPGGRDSIARPVGRQRALEQALGARALARRDVIDCSARSCRLNGAEVYASVAEPSVHGDHATVTVTVLRKFTSERFQYRTVNVLLQRNGRRWEVVGFEELGMS